MQLMAIKERGYIYIYIYTLDMRRMLFACLPRRFLTCSRSEPLRTKDKAMMSMLFGTPHSRMSSLSLSVNVGRSTTTPGRLTFFLSPRIALFSQRHRIMPFCVSHSKTVKLMVPSAHKTWLPGSKS